MTRVRTSSTRRRRITVKTRLAGGLVLLALAAVVTTAALAAGTTHTTKKATLKIGVSLAGYSTDFWSSYVAYEKQFAKQYGVSLVGPVPANGDAAKQATQIRTLITQGVQALIINPVDSAAIAPTLDYAARSAPPWRTESCGP